MAIDRRIGSKVSKDVRREETSALRVDPYPYIGIVKNNADSIRSGRLQVWIPDLGGDENEPKNWRTVSYASPFMGTTNQPKTSGTANEWTNVPHTYGMWMVPPDIGVEVICIFVGGDPLRGYWIACVNSSLSHYMMPGLAGSTNVEGVSGESAVPYPVAEFNENNITASHNSTWANNKKPVHEHQASILVQQGLDRDTDRGVISSSSQRESPSNVFGISTPGRPLNDPAKDPVLAKAVAAGKVTEDMISVKTRLGGHTFIMDDGDASGSNQLVRLRTASGHQIMMNDSAGILYIANASGTVWLEMANNGRLDIFAAGGFNLRTQGRMNLHSDGDININAGGSFNVKAVKDINFNSSKMNILTDGALTVGAGGAIGFNIGAGFNVEAKGTISLDTGTNKVITNGTILDNSAAGVLVTKPTPIKTNNLPDTLSPEGSDVFLVTPTSLETIATMAPTHEPYHIRGLPATKAYFTKITESVKASTVPKDPENGGGTQPQAYKGSVDATKSLDGKAVKRGISEKELQDQLDRPAPQAPIGPLSKDDLTAYLAQMGKSESSGNYNIEKGQYLGKYQMGILAMKDAGLIKDSVTDTSQLEIASNWIGGADKPSSKAEFLNSPELQEKAMWSITNKNYQYLLANGGITKEMPKEDVAGMLSASHLVGAGAAHSWRTTGATKVDGNNTTAEDYFTRGKYAVSVMGPKVAALRAG